MRNLLASLLILAAGSMSAAERPRVFNAPDSPVTITSFEVHFAGDAPVLKLRVRNPNTDVVENAGFELFAFTADGEIDAIYSFSPAFPIAAGGEALFVHRGEALDFTSEVSIVAVPVFALFSGRRWEIPPLSAAAAARSVVANKRDRQRPLAAETVPKELGIITPIEVAPAATRDCDLVCGKAESRCFIACSAGGVKEFSCLCSDSTLSTKCSCYAPPK